MCSRNMASNGWTLNSVLERLKAELDSTVQFWLQHSHDNECGSVLYLFHANNFKSHDSFILKWLFALPFTRR